MRLVSRNGEKVPVFSVPYLPMVKMIHCNYFIVESIRTTF